MSSINMAARKSNYGYDGKIAGLYDLEETIGRGHFAVVKLARHVFTGEKVAVKVIDKTKLDEVSRSHLFQEVRCMKLVQHPNVVRLYEVIDTQTKLYLILELGDGGDMYDYIMKHTGGLDEKLAKRYFRQIVEAISYCHKLHVVHRDLKPENVVFFEKLGLVKLTDFGFSNMFAPGKKLETSCGSLAYSAPEILLGDSYDAPAVDVWSLGVILYMLVVGEAPFQEANDSETLTMIMDCRYHVPPHISDKCRDLIGRMLQREPVSRATLPHIVAHPWLNDGDLTPVASYLPLITKEMISEEDQSYVIQKMVEGKIASREEILMSIEKNSYNHITATFYLLIERRLRKHQQHEYHLLQQQPSSGSLRKQSAPSPSRSAKPHLEPLMLSPRVRQRVLETLETPISPPATTVPSEDQERKLEPVEPAPAPAPTPPQSLPVYVVQGAGEGSADVGTSHYVQSLTSSPGAQSPLGSSPKGQLPSPTEGNLLAPPGTIISRKCSLIREESLDEYDDEEDDDVDIEATIKPVKSLESLDELGSGALVTLVPPSPPATSSSPALCDSVNPRRPLKSVCSSPQLLNQIHEENESEDEDDVVPLKLSTPRRFAGSTSRHRDRGSTSPEILRKYEQRKKRRGAGQRGTSCSSSDASDTDDTENRSRKEKLHHKFIHRRDSSDHSSDTDGPGGNLGGNGRLGNGGGNRGTSGGSHSQGGKSGGSGRGEGRGGGGGGRGGGGSEKKSSDNRNHSNNKNSVNNHKNSHCHGGGGGGSKGSLTDSSLKLLSRKLNEISTGVGALLSECRGSDCDNDLSLHRPPSTPPHSWDGNGSVSSGSLNRHHSRSTSLRSNSSIHSALHVDSNLFPLNEQFFSPVQYLGQSCDRGDSIGGPPLEFSELSQCVSHGDGHGSSSELGRPSQLGSQLCGTVAHRPSLDLSSGLLHCKPPPTGVSMVSSKSKCCSVV